MVKQYPYTLKVEVLEDSIQDENGDFTTGESKFNFLCNCRDEAGNGRLIQGNDGVLHQFSALIQCPKGTEAVKEGTRVKVLDNTGYTRIEGAVIFSRKDQLHTRLWL